eukprot:1955360-Karenia_brevis.AAC.1
MVRIATKAHVCEPFIVTNEPGFERLHRKASITALCSIVVSAEKMHFPTSFTVSLDANVDGTKPIKQLFSSQAPPVAARFELFPIETCRGTYTQSQPVERPSIKLCHLSHDRSLDGF